MIEKLNSLQGLFAVISIVITIILAFFAVNKITKKVVQKNKSGNNSSNVQIGNITINSKKDE